MLPLENDKPGEGAEFRLNTLALLDGATPVDSLIVAGEGEYEVGTDAQGKPTVTFTPERTFWGETTPVVYEVFDTNCQRATAEITFDVRPQLSIAKEADPTVVKAVGDKVEYTVKMTNKGQGDLTTERPATVVDDLSGVLDDATLDETSLSAMIGGAPVNTWSFEFDEATEELSSEGPLLEGETVEISYEVTYTAAGNVKLENKACVPEGHAADDSDECAEVTVLGAKLEPTKTVAPDAGYLTPGDTLTYTLTFDNTDGKAPATVNYHDYLGYVLDKASFVEGSIAVHDGQEPSGDLGVEGPGGDSLLLIEGEVPAGESRTVTYEVVVEDVLALESPDPGDPAPENGVIVNFLLDKDQETPTQQPGVDCEGTLTSTCSFIGGEVLWQKVNKNNTAHLSGSEWTITAADSSVDPIVVEDCIAEEASDCAGRDRDPSAGYFKVSGLPWGDYELRETEAPVGYKDNDTPYPFEVSGGDLDSLRDDLGQIENEMVDLPPLPLTGGRGLSIYMLVTGGFASAIMALAYGRRKTISKN